MRIETTVNVSCILMRRIDEAAAVTGKASQDIVLWLLKRIQVDYARYLNSSRRVQYQKKAAGDEWETFHMTVNLRDYEFLLDMRKLCKKTVSLLLAIAVEQYLKEMIEVFLNLESVNPDNYFYYEYLLIQKVYQNTVCWEINWKKHPT